MTTINTILLLSGILLALSVLASTLSARLGLPLLLVFLGIGMLAGQDGIGQIRFDDHKSAFFVGNLALAVILLDGGLRTSLATFRVALWPATTLATVGVAISAGLLGAFASWLLNVDWRYGLLLGAIVGSTDAAAVFSLLRHSGVRLNDRVRATLEIESGANDPMAVFLVLIFIEILMSHTTLSASSLLLNLVQQFGLGIAMGVIGGLLLAKLVGRLRLMSEGLYALLIASGGIAVFAATNMAGGSGFLAVYLAGLVIGNQKSRATEHVLRVMDGLAWLAQAGMFLVLGLLVTPSHLIQHGWYPLTIALFLIFVARPVAVLVCLLPFRFPAREIAYISWVGLRGAVPVVLAVFPLMAGVDNSGLLFDVAFAVVLVSLIIQGSSIPFMARRLKVVVPKRTEAEESWDLWLTREDAMHVLVFTLPPNCPLVGNTLLPDGRIHEEHPTRCLIAMRGSKRLTHECPEFSFEPGDRLWLLHPGEDYDDIRHLFEA
jgi:potassium/hydrogen antiporter